MNSPQDGINSILNTVEEWISELKHRTKETMKHEAYGGKKKKKDWKWTSLNGL